MTSVMEKREPNRLDLETRALEGAELDPLDLELANDWAANAEFRWAIPDSVQYPKPTNTEAVALFERGVALMRDNRMTAALEAYLEADKLIPTWPRLHINRYLVMERLRMPKEEYRRVLIEGLALLEMEAAGVIKPLETVEPVTAQKRRLLQASMLQNLADEFWEDALNGGQPERMADAARAFTSAYALFELERQGSNELWLHNATAFHAIRAADAWMRLGDADEAKRLTHEALRLATQFTRLYLNSRNYLDSLKSFDTLRP